MQFTYQRLLNSLSNLYMPARQVPHSRIGFATSRAFPEKETSLAV
jgi:hypothetical protein